MTKTQSNLETAAKGLLILSEADYPFEYITTNEEGINQATAVKLADKPEDTTVEETTLDYLLRNMTDESKGTIDAATASQFRTFVSVLNQELKNIKVFRVGTIQIDVFILGFTAEGSVAGMRTKLIET